MDAVVLGIPLVVFAVQGLRRKLKRAWFVVGFYAYPLLLFTALGSRDGALPTMQVEASLPLLRAGTITGFFLVGGLVAILRQLRYTPPWALLWVFLTIVAISVSALVNGDAEDALPRIVLTIMLAVNLFVIAPLLLREQLKEFCTAVIWLALLVTGVSVYTILTYGFWPAGAIRLGRPLGPGILGYLLAIAFVLSLKEPRWGTSGLLFLLTLLTASRAPFLGVVAAGAFYLMTIRRYRFVKSFGIGLVVVAGALVYMSYLEEALSLHRRPFERQTIDSGRFSLWHEALERIEHRPFTGTGDRTYGIDHYDRPTRFHNMPLEVAASFGIPAAILAMLVYVSMLRSLVSQRENPWFLVGVTLVLMALARTFVTTSAWINLADASNVIVTSAIITIITAPRARKLRPPEVSGNRPSFVEDRAGRYVEA